MICQSFLVPDLLNNQSDFLKFFLRHDFVQNRFQVLFNGGRWDETPGWCILHHTILKWRKSIVSVIGSSQLTRTNIELCEIEGCQLPGILSHINVYIFFFFDRWKSQISQWVWAFLTLYFVQLFGLVIYFVYQGDESLVVRIIFKLLHFIPYQTKKMSDIKVTNFYGRWWKFSATKNKSGTFFLSDLSVILSFHLL